MFATTVVHTTGVNWDGVLANVASITVILGVFATYISRSIKRSIKDEIQRVIEDKVTPALTELQGTLRNHSTRIARLEGVEEGKKQAVSQARIGPTG